MRTEYDKGHGGGRYYIFESAEADLLSENEKLFYVKEDAHVKLGGSTYMSFEMFCMTDKKFLDKYHFLF